MILPAQKAAAKVAIGRFGVDASILEPEDTDDSVDGYGKKREDQWNLIATEPVVRIYTSSSAPSQSRDAGGRYRTESPTLLFIQESAIQEGFRVNYGTSVYEIDSLTLYPSHKEASTTVVN